MTSKLTAARIATLKENGGMDRFVDRPRPGKRLDRKWCMTTSGDCGVWYHPETDRWVMRCWGAKKALHSIAGDSDIDRINAHWLGFCEANNA